jgi:hypothetical protein
MSRQRPLLQWFDRLQASGNLLDVGSLSDPLLQ